MNAAPGTLRAGIPASVDREAVAFVLSRISGSGVSTAEAVLPLEINRSIVWAHGATWLQQLAAIPTAERLEALAMVGIRRARLPYRR